MISGIYSAVFASNNNVVGTGVAVFSDNALHGGDSSYYYKGKYRLGGSNSISAAVEVANYSGVPSSIFGPLTSFRLTLNGTFSDQGFVLSGQVDASIV
jgi:hypothetical protein